MAFGAVFSVVLYGAVGAGYAQQATPSADATASDGCDLVSGNTVIAYVPPQRMIWSFTADKRSKYHQITQGTAGIFLGRPLTGTWKSKSSKCCWEIDGWDREDCFTFSEVEFTGNLSDKQPDQCWISNASKKDKCLRIKTLKPSKMIKMVGADGWTQSALLYDGIIKTEKVVRKPVTMKDLRPVSREEFKKQFGKYPEEMKLKVIE
ncbi:MAG: hypothetical protein AAFW74_07650 [Pseudomonadota bacterium]